MNGGLASRSAAPESAAPARAAPAAPAPVRALPAARVLDAEAGPAHTTRARLEASFAPAAPEVAQPITTRDRIVNRARATEPGAVVTLAPLPQERPEPVAVAAPVIDLTEARARRRPTAEPLAVPEREGPLAPVIVLEPKAGPPARAPPPVAPAVMEVPARGDEVAGEAVARAPPEAAPIVAPPAEDPGLAEPIPAEQAAPGDQSDAGEEAAPETAEPEAPEAEAAPEEAVAEPLTPAPPPVARNPEDDPAFEAMAGRVERNARRAKDHQPADVAAATAQGASEPDVEKDVGSQAAGEQVGVMGSKQPGAFDPAAFKAEVKKAVEAMAPPASLEEADEFEETGKAAGATAAIHGLVTAGKAGSERDIKVATETPPDPEGRTPKPVTPMVNDAPGPPLPAVGAESALPGLRPDSETDLSAGPEAIASKLAEANVTEEQLAAGNEPAFGAALETTQEVRDHAATAPAGYREQEAVVLAAGRAGAQQVAGTQTEAMHGARAGALDTVVGAKEQTKLADQKLYDDVHQGIIDIHAATQADVKQLLATLDSTVETIFTDGEAAARKTFEADVDKDMREYKRKRYSGFFGKGAWLKDRFFDLPDEVNRFYETRRGEYLAAMDRVIEAIAFTVGLLLGAAHARILAGRDQVTAFVEGLPESTRKLGKDAAADLDHKFDDLASDVDAKRDELVDTVARLYVDSRNQLDERIKELQEANKGLVSRAIDAVVGVLKTIYELGKLLLRVLLKAASAIGDILAHPIRFLGNLVDAVKGGLERFVSRIGDHLQKAMLDLLFGELGSAGITMPKQLDFAGILDLVLQVLGLTYKDIRERLVKRFGEETVARMEETVDVFKTLVRDGLAGLWTWVSEKLGDLEDLVIGKVKEYIAERVIKAGIGYIVALLNPAAAFIKACQGIYQIVMFVVERARQIATFVESILDSISAIAQGNVGAAVERIENALANGLSLAIAFLARLANLGALSEKVRAIIAAIRRPVTRVIDRVVFGAADLYRRTIVRAIAFGKEKVQAGKAFVKGKLTPEEERPKPQLAVAKVPEQVPPAEPPALDREWIYEKAEGGHTLRISRRFEVFRFSDPILVTGTAAEAVQQADLESKVARTPVTYPTDGLGRAAGPSGFVEGIKDNEGRAGMPAVARLPGGFAAYEPGDVRGHLIGDRFYGKATGGNLVPMHTTLNGSTFLSFESRMANAAKVAKAGGRGALLSMQITPDYPADDPANPGRKYRPNPVRADCRLYALDTGGGVSETPFNGSFANPSNAAATINLNSADRTEILAAFAGQLTPDVHLLVEAIVAVRPRRTVEGFNRALAEKLPADKLELFDTLLASRIPRFVLG